MLGGGEGATAWVGHAAMAVVFLCGALLATFMRIAFVVTVEPDGAEGRLVLRNSVRRVCCRQRMVHSFRDDGGTASLATKENRAGGIFGEAVSVVGADTDVVASCVSPSKPALPHESAY